MVVGKSNQAETIKRTEELVYLTNWFKFNWLSFLVLQIHVLNKIWRLITIVMNFARLDYLGLKVMMILESA